MEVLQGGEVVFPKATLSLAESRLELGILQSLDDACDIFLFEDFPFLQKHLYWGLNKTTLSRFETLPVKT